MKKNENIIRDTYIKRRVSDLDIGIFYECENINENICKLQDNDYYEPPGYLLKLKYNGFRLFHNETIPLQKNKVNFTELQFFAFIYLQFRALLWQVVRYEEIKGLFTKMFNILFKREEKDNYVDGYIASSELFLTDNYRLKDINRKKYKIIYRLMIFNSYDKHIQYKRISKGLLHVIGNICSFATLFNFIFYQLFLNFIHKILITIK